MFLQLTTRRAVRMLSFLVLAGSLYSQQAPERIRYTVRADPFEVELTLANGTKLVKQLTRQPTYFYHRVNIRWPMPEGPENKPLHCEVRWVGFPSEWRLINSYGVDEREQTFETTLGKLRKAVFAGGALRTVRSPKGLLLVTPRTWKLSDAAILDMADRIAEAHTAVWRDQGIPDHRLFLFPASTGAWGGEGRTKGLILEGDPETLEAASFAQIMSHELFHEWNARRLNWDNNEELYWFTEGFTEYYSVIALWRTGLWTFDQTIAFSNSIVKSYFGSPVRTVSAAEMVKLRPAVADAVRLPYLQGFLLAANWNLTGTSLDEAMRHLYRDNGEPLSNARIARALRSIGIQNAAEEIQRYIVAGAAIEIRPGLWGSCATEKKADVRGFDIGFDRKASEKTGIIEGIREDTSAWRAGIRNGQKWSALDVTWGDAGYQADLEITDQRGTRRVKYYPATTEVTPVPQYAVASPRCDPAKLP